MMPARSERVQRKRSKVYLPHYVPCPSFPSLPHGKFLPCLWVKCFTWLQNHYSQSQSIEISHSYQLVSHMKWTFPRKKKKMIMTFFLRWGKLLQKLVTVQEEIYASKFRHFQAIHCCDLLLEIDPCASYLTTMLFGENLDPQESGQLADVSWALGYSRGPESGATDCGPLWRADAGSTIFISPAKERWYQLRGEVQKHHVHFFFSLLAKLTREVDRGKAKFSS